MDDARTIALDLALRFHQGTATASDVITTAEAFLAFLKPPFAAPVRIDRFSQPAPFIEAQRAQKAAMDPPA